MGVAGAKAMVAEAEQLLCTGHSVELSCAVCIH